MNRANYFNVMTIQTQHRCTHDSKDTNGESRGAKEPVLQGEQLLRWPLTPW